MNSVTFNEQLRAMVAENSTSESIENESNEISTSESTENESNETSFTDEAVKKTYSAIKKMFLKCPKKTLSKGAQILIAWDDYQLNGSKVTLQLSSPFRKLSKKFSDIELSPQDIENFITQLFSLAKADELKAYFVKNEGDYGPVYAIENVPNRKIAYSYKNNVVNFRPLLRKKV